MKILVIGLTSTSLGGMEFRNLGNYIIIEPLFSYLRAKFQKCEITTTIQLSDAFCKRFDIDCLRDKRFWTYGFKAAGATVTDIIRVILWKVTRLDRFLMRSLFLRELKSADAVIDFSGDVYGDNAPWNKYLESNARLLFARALGKPVAMVIGSPGPFSSTWRLLIAKRILPKIDLVTNREPLSTAMLAYVGVTGDNIRTTACPSVLFRKADRLSLRKKQDYAELFESTEPTIGLILCGWNMPVGPYNKWPREDSEFRPFIKLIEHLVDTTAYRICVMTHQNGTNSQGKLEKGADHRLVARLLELAEGPRNTGRLFTLSDLYNAAESKTIISSFEILISGRIHGAVQGLSQYIPTAIVDYGHHPKAHKLRGFARVYGVDDFVLEPHRSEDMCRAVDNLIRQRESERRRLMERVPDVKRAALENFNILAKMFSSDDNQICASGHDVSSFKQGGGEPRSG